MVNSGNLCHKKPTGIKKMATTWRSLPVWRTLIALKIIKLEENWNMQTI